MNKKNVSLRLNKIIKILSRCDKCTKIDKTLFKLTWLNVKCTRNADINIYL